jgi:hypothetical protein
MREYLIVDFSRYPACSPEEMAALFLTEDEFQEILRREQEEADQRYH